MITEQESIPIGCVPPALMAITICQDCGGGAGIPDILTPLVYPLPGIPTPRRDLVPEIPPSRDLGPSIPTPTPCEQNDRH